MRKAKSPARKQTLFRQIEAGAGRENIAGLLLASGNPRASRLLDMMLDPAYEGLSFGQLCSRAGLSAGEVMRLILQRNLAEGMIRSSFHLPDIMENLVLAAKGHEKTCSSCEGEGVYREATCPLCEGSGHVRHTFLTRLGQSGCDVWTLARIAGHSSISISARYVHPSEDAVLEAMARLGGHNSGHMPNRYR